MVLYKIWPLPFDSFSKAVILPSVNVVVESGKTIYSPIRLLVDLNTLDQKNKDLEQANTQLEADNAKLKNDSLETAQLLLEINKSKATQKVVVAKVIARNPGGFNQEVIVNKGESDGITNGSAVLSQGYFIGRVTKVDQSQCEVELIFSHNSLVPVKMDKNLDGGLLQGGLEGLTITDIPINSTAETGDNVLTSGLGGDIPSGLLVGKIGLHLGLDGELFQKVQVISPINPASVEFVSIIQL